jgi:hypothetical protein
MPQANIHEDIWIRWIHSTWENHDEWRTDIRPSVLNDASVTKALFILDDGSCLFIPMAELRRVLSSKQPSGNGSITFSVNPHLKTVEQSKVSMSVLQSKRGKAQNLSKAFAGF